MTRSRPTREVWSRPAPFQPHSGTGPLPANARFHIGDNHLFLGYDEAVDGGASPDPATLLVKDTLGGTIIVDVTFFDDSQTIEVDLTALAGRIPGSISYDGGEPTFETPGGAHCPAFSELDVEIV